MWCVGFFCEIFGMVGKGDVGVVDDVFVYWCGYYGSVFVGLVIINCVVEYC